MHEHARDVGRWLPVVRVGSNTTESAVETSDVWQVERVEVGGSRLYATGKAVLLAVGARYAARDLNKCLYTAEPHVYRTDIKHS